MDLFARGRPIEAILRRIVLAVIVAVFLGPVVLIILTSLKTRVDALASPPLWIFKPTLDNYIHIFVSYTFETFMLNSFVAAGGATLLSMLLGTLAAYSLARFPFRGSEGVSYWILSLRMAPAIASIIPLFILLRTIHLIDTSLGLILVYTSANLPLVIWVMRGFFEDIPQDMEECALVDGASRVGAFLKIALPLVAPGVAATAILAFLFSWNEFLFALILTSRNAQTMPVAVMLFMRETGIDWGYMTAAATIMMVPMLVSTVFVQRGLVRGLTMGAVK